MTAAQIAAALAASALLVVPLPTLLAAGAMVAVWAAALVVIGLRQPGRLTRQARSGLTRMAAASDDVGRHAGRTIAVGPPTVVDPAAARRVRRGLERTAVALGLARPASEPVSPTWPQLRQDRAGAAAVSSGWATTAAGAARHGSNRLAWALLAIGAWLAAAALAWLRWAAAGLPAFLRATRASTLAAMMRVSQAIAAIRAGLLEALSPVQQLARELVEHAPTWPQTRTGVSRAVAAPVVAATRFMRLATISASRPAAATPSAGSPMPGVEAWPSWARIRGALARAARAVDRAIAAVLVAAVRLVAGVAAGVARLLATAVVGAARVTGRAGALAVVVASRLTVATAVLAVTALLAVALIPPAASGLTGALHLSNPEAGQELTLPPLRERSRVVSADGAVLGELHGEVNRDVVPLERIPELMQQAVVTAEDRRFYQHDGFDLQGIMRAAWTNLQAGSIEAGGSTITQQVAKKNFTGGDRTLDRKLTELRYARALESELTKDQILERYLNQVYFGRGAYGVAAGAEAFFGRPVAYLEAHQAALLAGMIAAPGYFNPDTNPERARRRRNEVLQGMAAQGFLSQERAELAASRPLDVIERSEANPDHLAPYIVAQVKRELLASPALGATLQKRINALFEGGLTIHTSINWRLQQRADRLIADNLGDRGPTAAMVVMDDHTGELVVATSGRKFSEDQFDPALQGRRQPGSAFKPFVLTTALRQGMSLSDPINANSPAVLEFGGLRPWHVTNYGGKSLGTLTLAGALQHSSNTAFARLMLKVGQDNVEITLERLGIDVDRALGERRALSPAIALGGVARGMTLPEMATAYSALTTDGRRAPSHLVTKVTGPDGDVVLSNEQPERPRAVSPEIAAKMRTALRGVVEAGTGTRAQIPGRVVVGKTGTTQQSADAWFVGQTSGLVGAVWVGHPENRIPMPGMTGGSLPAQLWRQIITASLAQPGVPPS